MDDEFHYYITFIVALRAGFDHRQAYILAYSSQYVDDNTKRYSIDGTRSEEPYENYITQTPNIFKPREDLMRIYPVFHFMPGGSEEIHSDSCRRSDGKLHLLNTVAGNSHSQLLLKSAVESGNLYLTGIASHMFADTFSHQNFVGYKDSFNGMEGLFASIAPSIGHLDARNNPDRPCLVWQDHRLVTTHRIVRNKDRFLAAARELHQAYCSLTGNTDEGSANMLIRDLTDAMGPEDNENQLRNQRISGYIRLIGPAYRQYGVDEWFSGAVNSSVAASSIICADDYSSSRTIYTWKQKYTETDWYCFQEAAKWFQREALSRVLSPIFATIELTGL